MDRGKTIVHLHDGREIDISDLTPTEMVAKVRAAGVTDISQIKDTLHILPKGADLIGMTIARNPHFRLWVDETHPRWWTLPDSEVRLLAQAWLAGRAIGIGDELTAVDLMGMIKPETEE